MPRELSADYVRDCLSYDPDTGILRWKERPRRHFKSEQSKNRFNTMFAGKRAGTVQMKSAAHDYKSLVIGINGKYYLAHRLAWLITYGHWPKRQIDHRNRNPLDNRIANLRDVSHSVNMLNRGILSSNTSGATGVHLSKRHRNYRAYYIGDHLGVFDTFQEAVAARRAAEMADPRHLRQ